MGSFLSNASSSAIALRPKQRLKVLFEELAAPTGQRNTHPTHGCALPRSFRRTHRLVVVHANAQRRSTLRCPGVFAHQTFQCGPSDRTGFSGRLSLLRVNMGIRQGWSSCGHIRSISALSSAPSSTTNAMT